MDKVGVRLLARERSGQNTSRMPANMWRLPGS